MISVIIYDHISDEMVCISSVIKDIVAVKSQDKSRIDVCSNRSRLFEIAEQMDIEDFVLIDICEKNGTDIAVGIRKRYPETRILLIHIARMLYYSIYYGFCAADTAVYTGGHTRKTRGIYESSARIAFNRFE